MARRFRAIRLPTRRDKDRSNGTYTYTDLSFTQAGTETISVSGPPDPQSSYPPGQQPSSVAGSGSFSVLPAAADGTKSVLIPGAATVPFGTGVTFTLVTYDQFENKETGGLVPNLSVSVGPDYAPAKKCSLSTTGTETCHRPAVHSPNGSYVVQPLVLGKAGFGNTPYTDYFQVY